jgi:glycosyltransferase involved in cell wall biosynthesis
MVSIIVITYSIEREPDIKDLLASLRDQTFRDFEVIVVVEKSRDLPARLLEYAGMIELTNLRVLVNDAEPGPAPSTTSVWQAHRAPSSPFWMTIP